MEHRVSFKVYYEDTDSLGIVYYANHLRFLERGRTEFLEAHGPSVAEWNRSGVVVVVRSVRLTYRRPARLGDLLDVVSRFSLGSRFRGVFHQRLERAGELIADGEVEVVCLDAEERLTSFPEVFRAVADRS